MVRERLEQRVGPVVLVGVARAVGYTHGFTKLGRDGTGKGNLMAAPDRPAHGVVYRLQQEQMSALHRFEGGYERFSLQVDELGQASASGSAKIQVESFRAIAPVAPLRPTKQYVAFYERAMREHDLPEPYRTLIRDQVQTLWQTS